MKKKIVETCQPILQKSRLLLLRWKQVKKIHVKQGQLDKPTNGCVNKNLEGPFFTDWFISPTNRMAKSESLCKKHSPEKSVKQTKAKLALLKEAYKQAKDNNAKTRPSLCFSLYCEDFDEKVGEWYMISLKKSKISTNPVNMHTDSVCCSSILATTTLVYSVLALCENPCFLLKQGYSKA